MIPSHDSTPSLPRIGSTNDDEDVFLARFRVRLRASSREGDSGFLITSQETTSLLSFIHHYSHSFSLPLS